MYFAKYLLSMEEFKNTEEFRNAENWNMKKEKALMERAFSCVDETRRKKAERMRPGQARAACLGGGLLLQLAVGEALGVKTGRGKADGEAETSTTMAGMQEIRRYNVSQLLARIEHMPLFSLNYTYGEKGKPYFKEYPFYFNLSHSGDYVLCGLATEEIGADIQQHCGKDVGKLARRFFSERETAALEQAGEAREKLFYRLWARKEAYGKLTGKGIADALNMDLFPENGRAMLLSETALPDGSSLIWEEYNAIESYSIAFCRYKEILI